MIKQYLRKLSLYENYYQKQKIKQSEFYEQNRINVILTYRYFLKTIPKIYPRYLQRAQKIHELRYFFKSSKHLTDRYQTQVRTKLALKIADEVRNKDYSSLGDYIPNEDRTIDNNLRFQIAKKVSGPKKWWRGGYLF